MVATDTPCVVVMGVGGAGMNMLAQVGQPPVGSQGRLLAVNTDHAALALAQTPHIQTLPIGHGGQPAVRPEVGLAAVKHSAQGVAQALAGATHLHVLAGLGGGTGSGAAPEIARIGLALGLQVHVWASMPFVWEGPMRHAQAQVGLAALRAMACPVTTVSLADVMCALSADATLQDTLTAMDGALLEAACLM